MGGGERKQLSQGADQHSAAGYLTGPFAVIFRDGGSDYDRPAWQ